MTKISFWESAGAVVRNSLRVQRDHFSMRLPRARAIALFQASVELIEVETTSYCNRACVFCPNAFIDRRSEKLEMPDRAWHTIVADLGSVQFGGTFVWSRYSEPLSERRILDRIREVRQAAPNCRIAINSNGDYLNADFLSELEQSGLNRLFVDIYMPDDEIYERKRVDEYLQKFISRIGRTYKIIETEPELRIEIASSAISLMATVKNVASMKRTDMSDRGGLIELARQSKRSAPCFAPFKHLVIDWDGSVLVCCQLRSDALAHKDAVVGKIGAGGVGLIEAYTNLALWRQSLAGFGPKQGPCATCNVAEYAENTVTRSASLLFSDPSSFSAIISRAVLRPLLSRRFRW